MKTIILSDLYKLVHGKLLLVILGLVVFQVIFQTTSSEVRESLLLNGQDGVNAISEGTNFICIWIAAFTGFFIASEFQNSTIRNVLSLGKKRSYIYVSKYISVCLAASVILMAFALVATATYSLQLGFGNKSAGEYLLSFVCIFGMQSIYHFSYTGVFTLIAFICRNTGVTILAGIIYIIASLTVSGYFSRLPEFAFISQWTPDVYTAFAAEIYENGNIQLFIKSLVVSFSYIVITVFAGCIIFNHSDVK